MPNIRRLLRAARTALLVLACVLFVPVVVALIGVGIECRPFGGGASPEVNTRVDAGAPLETAAARQATSELPVYTRSEDQTYLTLPEWYIVYSADEYARFLEDRPPSRFPYFRAIGQYWQSYYDVCAVTRERYSFNSGYHLSLAVIGTSFTIENILKGIYENTIGRLTEWISSDALTEEDAYAREVAGEYGTFLHTVPWYEFPFGTKLRGLWRETDLWGPNVVRKWERKIALSLEYGTKSVYGWLIKQATGTVYSAEDLTIYAWVTGLSDRVVQEVPELRVATRLDPQSAIVALPRYEAFTGIVPNLTRRGVRFVEIAGNDDILVTAIAPHAWANPAEYGRLLFEMPILTQPQTKRIVVSVPVPSLHLAVDELSADGSRVEHIYDY